MIWSLAEPCYLLIPIMIIALWAQRRQLHQLEIKNLLLRKVDLSEITFAEMMRMVGIDPNTQRAGDPESWLETFSDIARADLEAMADVK